MRDRTRDEAMAELFQKDTAYGVELLNSILEDGEESERLIVLRQMARMLSLFSRKARISWIDES